VADDDAPAAGADGLPEPGERKTAEGQGPTRGLYPLARSGFIEYDRVLFFSDAVFAIAITLLAVNLHVPGNAAHGGITVGTELHNALPRLEGFGISFAVIAQFWLGHHGIFRYITAFDRPLITLNLLFLGTIAFLPYPTEVLSQNSLSGSGTLIFYSACVAAAGLAEGAVWIYANYARDDLTHSSVGQVRWQFTLRIARVPAVFLVSIPVALVAPRIVPFLWILIWVLGVLINRMTGTPEPRGN
jgi:uncharacterized membrane protein